ncbi:E3 ubiquitin-protein ligase MARCHF5 [Drosophila grimshawi]|uniref:E3 ubiquitin-protein ligase MARCHF5 n=1 Tax=Drosophila grimshawi TaxID=7222 RepID=B4JJT2_DROGR|nr:E3 ubiquitin-protein ligase MARCHF5 [Drosophila grimshawi]EDV99834.1 GH12186 [Drosophila grimshawi]
MTGRGIALNTTRELESERTCWICFATESENRRATWVHPCECRGSTKWVHESCLSRWIDEKQNGDTRMKVICMQCRFEYHIIFPKVGRIAMFLELCGNAIRRLSPFVTAFAVLLSVYWAAVTYGGITLIQVLGMERGMELIEQGDAIFILIGLPIIPVVLIISRFFRWEDILLQLWHNRHSVARKLPLINRLLYAHTDVETVSNVEDTPLADAPFDFSSIFCGAFLMPSISTIFGWVLYRNVASALRRTLLGGFTFIAVKGILKIYLRQKVYLKKRRRHIIDYTEENVRIHTTGAQSNQLQANM